MDWFLIRFVGHLSTLQMSFIFFALFIASCSLSSRLKSIGENKITFLEILSFVFFLLWKPFNIIKVNVISRLFIVFFQRMFKLFRFYQSYFKMEQLLQLCFKIICIICRWNYSILDFCVFYTIQVWNFELWHVLQEIMK